MNALQKGLYGLEVAARCAKGAWAHPPAVIIKGIHYCKRHSSLKVPQITLRHQEKSCSEWFLPGEENQSRVGAPESWARRRWTDGRSAKKGKRSPSVIPEFKPLGKGGEGSK